MSDNKVCRNGYSSCNILYICPLFPLHLLIIIKRNMYLSEFKVLEILFKKKAAL